MSTTGTTYRIILLTSQLQQVMYMVGDFIALRPLDLCIWLNYLILETKDDVQVGHGEKGVDGQMHSALLRQLRRL